MSQLSVAAKCLNKLYHQKVSPKSLNKIFHQKFPLKCLMKMCYQNMSTKKVSSCLNIYPNFSIPAFHHPITHYSISPSLDALTITIVRIDCRASLITKYERYYTWTSTPVEDFSSVMAYFNTNTC